MQSSKRVRPKAMCPQSRSGRGIEHFHQKPPLFLTPGEPACRAAGLSIPGSAIPDQPGRCFRFHLLVAVHCPLWPACQMTANMPSLRVVWETYQVRAEARQTPALVHNELVTGMGLAALEAWCESYPPAAHT